MINIIQSFFIALSFLTVLPVSLNLFKKEIEGKEKGAVDLSKASVFFPLVGLLMGGILFSFYKLTKLIYTTAYLESGFILAIWIVLSGGLHLEGLADMVDGFSGGKNQKDIIRIMKEGSIGAKGAIALIILILFKYLLLLSLAESVKGEALLIAPMIGRWTMVLIGYLGKPASSSNTLTKMFTQYLGKKELLISTLFTLSVSFFIMSSQSIYLPILFFIITTGITFYLIIYSNKKIKGICGDVIGSVNEINELVVLGISLLI